MNYKTKWHQNSFLELANYFCLSAIDRILNFFKEMSYIIVNTFLWLCQAHARTHFSAENLNFYFELGGFADNKIVYGCALLWNHTQMKSILILQIFYDITIKIITGIGFNENLLSQFTYWLFFLSMAQSPRDAVLHKPADIKNIQNV